MRLSDRLAVNADAFTALTDDEVDDLRDLWMSRLMFNPMVGWAPETRSFDEYVEAVVAARTTAVYRATRGNTAESKNTHLTQEEET